MEINFWLIFGLLAQFVFFMRFVVQWIASERRKESYIPVEFWYLSLVGSIGLLIYAIHKKDIVFILGLSVGSFVYIRNLILIYKKKNGEKNRINLKKT
jgi:lipid-A-disaccharide synthase-like uncharacterized protein